MVAWPADGFVASFTGASLLHGTAHAENGLTAIRLQSGDAIYSTDARSRSSSIHLAVGPRVVASFKASGTRLVSPIRSDVQE